MKKKKTVVFADEDVVISHIVSVRAYEKAYKCYVEVKTATREYVEEFEEEGYSLSKVQINATIGLSQGTELGEKHFGKVTKEELNKRDRELEDSKVRLHKKVIKRRDEILRLL
jgi:hypothetical protein